MALPRVIKAFEVREYVLCPRSWALPLPAPGPHLWWSNSPVVGPPKFQVLKIRGVLTEKISSDGI